jgi:hypothetical protein
VNLDTYAFHESAAKTTVRSISSFQSVEHRDRIVEQGMEAGARSSAEQLADLIAKLRPDE